MIEIRVPEEEMPPNNHSREEAHGIIKLLVNAYNMGYKDGVEAYKTMMEIESEENSAQWVDNNDNKHFTDYRCSKCNNYVDTDYPYCPYCGRKMING